MQSFQISINTNAYKQKNIKKYLKYCDPNRSNEKKTKKYALKNSCAN